MSATAPRRCSPPWRLPPAALPTPAAAPPPRRVPGLPQACRQGLPASAVACGGGQLRHPQAPADPGLAGQASSRAAALHADLWLLAQPGRGVLRDHRSSGAAPRRLRRGGGAGWRRSVGSATAGINAATRSPGPRTPIRSSPSSTVKPTSAPDQLIGDVLLDCIPLALPEVMG
jgi:hypothetical protein